MDRSRFRCTLESPGGGSRRVGPQGLLIGRQPGADILLQDPSVSRRHALIRLGSDGVELVPLGRLAVEHNDQPCERIQLLADGDRIRIGELVFTVRVELPAPETTTTGFRVVRNGTTYGISHTPFVIGGGASDDLILSGWPPNALRFHVAQGELFIDVTEGEAMLSGAPVEANALAPIEAGEVLLYRDETFEIARADDRAHTTLLGAVHALPSKIVVEMLPRGGRVTFTLATGEHTVYLADRRLDLIIALVRPPTGYQPGDFVPDDVLRQVVWPRRPSIIRSDINLHITRCRRDLLAVGLAGPRLIERAPTGGATRLSMRAGCEIVFL